MMIKLKIITSVLHFRRKSNDALAEDQVDLRYILVDNYTTVRSIISGLRSSFRHVILNSRYEI